jgi:hypothetical protein
LLTIYSLCNSTKRPFSSLSFWFQPQPLVSVRIKPGSQARAEIFKQSVVARGTD